MEYESEIQKVLFTYSVNFANANKLQHARLCFVVSGLKIIDHGNPDNNLESHCIFISGTLIKE
jgi:hypothetical protein